MRALRLQWALHNLRFLMEGIPPRFWGEGEAFGDDDEPVRCAHIISEQFVVDGMTGLHKRNRHGEMIKHVRRCKLTAPPGFTHCHLHGGPSGIKPAARGLVVADPMWLVVLAADINREIDNLPPRQRRLFELLYRDPLPLSRNANGALDYNAWYDDGHHERYVDDVKRRLGFDQPAVFEVEHDDIITAMEWRLIHHFPAARHAA